MAHVDSAPCSLRPWYWRAKILHFLALVARPGKVDPMSGGAEGTSGRLGMGCAQGAAHNQRIRVAVARQCHLPWNDNRNMAVAGGVSAGGDDQLPLVCKLLRLRRRHRGPLVRPHILYLLVGRQTIQRSDSIIAGHLSCG